MLIILQKTGKKNSFPEKGSYFLNKKIKIIFEF